MFSRLPIFALFIFISGVLTACLAPEPEVDEEATKQIVLSFLATSAPLAPYGVGQSYEVNGVRYTPQEDFSYNRRGIASFYSSVLNGALTASGEAYSSTLMTAAHKTLPFQTIVRVTNTRSGAVTIVRINDRGPFQGDRIIDLSERAARDLGMIDSGIADVRVEVMEAETRLFAAALANGRVIPGEQPTTVTPTDTANGGAGGATTTTPATPTTPADPAATGGYYVLVGTYTNRADAEAIRSRMASLGRATVEEESGVFKVYVGPLSSRLEAQAMLGRVFAEGATNASVVLR